MKQFSTRLLVLAVLAGAISIAAYGQDVKLWPSPKSSSQPQVFCTGCDGKNAFSLDNAGLKVAHFSSPILAHTGKFIDGVYTNDDQGHGLRTVRGGRMLYAPGRGRLYMQNGAMLGVYPVADYFTKVAAGVVPVTSFPSLTGSYGRSGTPFESLIIPAQYGYPEASGSGWTYQGVDSQDRLYDIDIDDRQFVYAAYSVLGWGIFKDDGAGPGTLGPRMMPTEKQVTSGKVTSTRIACLKDGSSYYTIVSDGNRGTAVDIWNVTNTKSPTLVSNTNSRDKGFISWAKNSDSSRLAIVNGNQQVGIYTSHNFILGGQAIRTEVASSGRAFVAVTSDGTNFYAAESGASFTGNLLWKFTPNVSGDYDVTKYNILGSFQPLFMQGGDSGYLTIQGQSPIAGSAASAGDVRVINIGGADPVNVPIGDFFTKYYTLPPADYARPAGYTSLLRGSMMVKYGGKTYLFFATYGLADVYEFAGGESITVDYDHNQFGTVNLNAKPTQSGPFYGDRITFTALLSSTTSSSIQTEWNFGNPEPVNPNNIQNNIAVGTTTPTLVPYQYRNLTTTGQIEAQKTINVKNQANPQVAGSASIIMKTPIPRIGVQTSPGVSAALTSGTGVALLTSDRFTDASDGSVESHYASWTIDTTAPVALAPNQPKDPGACGTHNISLTTNYGEYSPSFVSAGTPYVPAAVNVTSYTVRPFTVTIDALTPTSTNFSATVRRDSSAVTATTWTTKWSLKNGVTDLVPSVPHTDNFPNVTPLPVPAITIPPGSVLTLEVTVDQAGIVPACQSFNTMSVSMTLAPPQADIQIGGCVHAGEPCTFTAVATSGTTAGWTYAWKLINTSPQLTSTVNPFQTSVPNSGNYIAEVKVTQSIFSTTVQKNFEVLPSLCSGLPDTLLYGVFVFGGTSGCTGSNCSPGETITLDAGGGGYVPKACDTYEWTFGDGTGQTLTGVTSNTVQHVYAGGNGSQYTVSLKVTNNSGSKTYTGTVKFGAPPPDCLFPVGVNFSWTGDKGCSPSKSCEVGELITFGPTNSFQSCDQYAWTFQSNGSSSQRSPGKIYAAAGTYAVSLTISNTKGTAPQVSKQITVVQGGGGTCSTHATVLNIDPSFTGPSSGCSDKNGLKCSASEAVQFNVNLVGNYTKQDCDQFEWTFDDGSAAVQGQTVQHQFL
ncbi:MAG TPA: PKD domain-containing protein, partial [Thermoanaerobaculia bacterium]|nr:PKD domain-containing protein [Thermoanaerobaculia bacterium]